MVYLKREYKKEIYLFHIESYVSGQTHEFFLPQITRIITNFSYSKNKNTLIVSAFDRFVEYYNFQIGVNS
jgi:hypothetical protein